MRVILSLFFVMIIYGVAPCVPMAINPRYFSVYDSGSVQPKMWPKDSVVSDSVTHSVYSDTADTALNTPDSVGKADTANIAKAIVHGVNTHYIPYANSAGTFSDSALFWGNWNYYEGGPVLYLGTYSIQNPTLLIYNQSASANTSADINLYNGSTTFGYASGVCRILWKKLTTGTYSGYSEFSLITTEDATPDIGIKHIVIPEQTGQLIFNDTIYGASPVRTWNPIWIKNGGLKIEDSVIINDLPMISMTDTVLIARGTGKVGGISASSFRTGIGAVTSSQVHDSINQWLQINDSVTVLTNGWGIQCNDSLSFYVKKVGEVWISVGDTIKYVP